MARQITCDMCKAEPAAAMYSTMNDGTTLAIGDNCAPSFAYGLAVATGILPDPSAEPEPVAEVAEAPAPAHSGKAPRDRSKRSQSVPEESAVGE
jgi:hypothetical protein